MSTALEGRRSETGVTGGSVATSIDTAYAASIANTSALAGKCVAIVDELNRRARLCDQYTADMQSYERRFSTWSDRRLRYFQALDDGNPVAWPGPAPAPPPPPFPGAETE